MNTKTQKKITLPPIGMRIIKSTIGVFLGFVIYYIRGCQGTPFYTALSVLWCMRAYVSEAKKMAKQRTIGTFIGGFYGFLFIVAEMATVNLLGIVEDHILLRFMFISLMLIPVIYTTVILDKKNASYFACVVFLSIVVLHIEDENPYLFVFNRVLDTLVGIFVGLLVNTFRLPCKYNEDTLFISGLDDTLLDMNVSLTPYSLVELNRMIDEGANFTVSTMWTPASIVEGLRGIHLKLPVIAMDGAVLYDIKKNAYIKKCEIPYDEAAAIKQLIDKEGLTSFINVIDDDVWKILYSNFSNDIEEKIYESLKRSPYRNYLKQPLIEGEGVVYFMMIHPTELIEEFYKKLETAGICENYKVLKYQSDEYPDYSYIKIYNKDATRPNMEEALRRKLHMDETVTFGSIEGRYDVFVTGDDANQVVKTLKKMYEIPTWRKQEKKIVTK